MKSPATLSHQLARQWEYADIRESRLLGDQSIWPISLPIGKPTPRHMASNVDTVKQHIESWRKAKYGKVIWDSIASAVPEAVTASGETPYKLTPADQTLYSRLLQGTQRKA